MTSKAIPPLLAALALTGVIAAAAAPAASAGPFDDLTFDGDGRLLLQEPAYGRAVAVQPDGRIVVADSDLADDVAVWRLHPDGSPRPELQWRRPGSGRRRRGRLRGGGRDRTRREDRRRRTDAGAGGNRVWSIR